MSNYNKLFKEIAKENKTSVNAVKKEIRKAIDATYENSNPYADSIPCKGEIPTIEEFLDFCIKNK